MDKSVSFEKDIVPIFRQFRDSMMWRLDLTSFDDLKANASMIYNQILWTPGTPVTPQNRNSIVQSVDGRRLSVGARGTELLTVAVSVTHPSEPRA